MNIYNVIILDESGSMSSIYRETIQSMNEVLGGIRKNQEEFSDQRQFVSRSGKCRRKKRWRSTSGSA